MVLKDGKIVEFGEPNLLLRNPDSYYTKQVNIEAQNQEKKEADEKKKQAILYEEDVKEKDKEVKGIVKKPKRNFRMRCINEEIL